MTQPGFTAPGFTGALIDRADHVRNSPDLLAAAMGSLSARLLRLDGIDPFADEQGALLWGSLAEAPSDAELAFLGFEDGKARFVALPTPGPHNDARSRSAWRVILQLRSEQAALYAAARSLIDWHGRHPHCSMCGGMTHMAKGGWQRDCPSCGAEHFPRTNPVVIMLAEQHDPDLGDAVLVGRQHAWPARNYSALAGFVEPGESIEEAVARELFEEAGVRASNVRYVASQPWPFPSQLMIGCIASVPDRALTLDASEIEAAMWVTRDDVRSALAGDPDARMACPPPFAIAHTLLERWASE
ncbi:MAG: NAD(+) diphosphatase [Pseudomonadota bacterium]